MPHRMALIPPPPCPPGPAQGSAPAGCGAEPPVPGCAAGEPPPEGLGGPGFRHWGGAAAASSLSRLSGGGGTPDISVNPFTKLMVPGPNCAMLPASGHAGSVPPGYFIHPDTGKVLPEAGNLGYDLQGATLVPTTDFSSGGIRTSEAAVLPYVPYPTCPATGSPPATHLPILQPRRTSQLGALMTDPTTGIEVPVLAVTLHPQTRQWLTLGGTYCNPLTKTLAPLELGGPMEDPVTGSISPILGVGLDENTGMMCYPGTELWVPVLYGMEIPDPEGSGLMVPILGMETDGNSGDATPLAGSMEDADGKGLIPISIGAQATDPFTGEPGPVIGAQTDPSTGLVVPIVQGLEALPRGVRDPGLLDTLEKELRAREQYWRRQEQEELRLAERLGQLSVELLSAPGKDAQRQLGAAEEALAALEARRLQETERRARALSTPRGPERGLLSQADREEWEQEAQMMLGVQKVLQTLAQTAEKLRQAGGRLRGREQEMWLQQHRSPSPHVWNRPWKVAEHLSEECQEVVRHRQNFLDRALGLLQYQRELSRLHLFHTQIVASGSPACLENYPGDRFYGMITPSLRDPAAACPLLIPFLKSVTAVLEGAQGRGPGLEDQGPATDADKADIMWTSPLLSTLKKVDIWSQARKEEAELQGQMHHQLAPKSPQKGCPKTSDNAEGRAYHCATHRPFCQRVCGLPVWPLCPAPPHPPAAW
ncbi:uncharacterized protein LOC111153940 isoform X2 [Enhydra lutris kenyoni]|uniref:Uncharacterized protein LOC111153940 isoform X2 n=1 Tax=Enhydra lutris kenyoni TaxID=391180 RepID=A0A2Y9K5S1_ENHLU|nr:uncharacterized protein LOC111153940 isoform X2 [Enhydra lutris kenyoni]